MTLLTVHPQRALIRAQLAQNLLFRGVARDILDKLEPHLTVIDCRKGEVLLHQGVHEMEQYFILDGILKRMVTNQQAKEMILRFADERSMETSYAAWKLKTPTPYSIVSVTKARVAKLPLHQWVAFLEDHPQLKETFEFEVMRQMSEIMAHTITLHLLDAPHCAHRFLHRHPELGERIPGKDLASYLNICAETLCRLKHQGKI